MPDLADVVDVLPRNQESTAALPQEVQVELNRMVSSVEHALSALEGADLRYSGRKILDIAGENAENIEGQTEEQLRSLLVQCVEKLARIDTCRLEVVYNLVSGIARAAAKVRAGESGVGKFQRRAG